MADNTEQYDLMVVLRENLDGILPDFVAANLFWYPVEGQPRIVQAPDVMVAFGRPKGARRSYKQWVEGGTPPEVVVEILSRSNNWREMARKGVFYLKHGAREFYVLDPATPEIDGWILTDDGLMTELDGETNWVSPRLGIRFGASEDGRLAVFFEDGTRFSNFQKLRDRTAEAQLRAEEAEPRADDEKLRADDEKLRADAAESRALALETRLKELGADPSSA